MLTVSESGLYSLIFRSRKPEAKRFRKWVTAEVLPALRKHGFYGSAEQVRALDLVRGLAERALAERADNIPLTVARLTSLLMALEIHLGRDQTQAMLLRAEQIRNSASA
jgi:prophage antirepressor-like protein